MDRLVINNDILFAEVLQRLSEGKEVIIPCKGVSMLPFIRPGIDTVKLGRIDSVKPGDIVLFHLHGRYLLHRVQKVGPKTAKIMGDGSIKFFEICPIDHIYAKAISILRNGTEEVNPYSPTMMFKARIWKLLLPIRRYLLYIYRHLPIYREIEKSFD